MSEEYIWATELDPGMTSHGSGHQGVVNQLRGMPRLYVVSSNMPDIVEKGFFQPWLDWAQAGQVFAVIQRSLSSEKEGLLASCLLHGRAMDILGSSTGINDIALILPGIDGAGFFAVTQSKNHGIYSHFERCLAGAAGN